MKGPLGNNNIDRCVYNIYCMCIYRCMYINILVCVWNIKSVTHRYIHIVYFACDRTLALVCGFVCAGLSSNVKYDYRPSQTALSSFLPLVVQFRTKKEKWKPLPTSASFACADLHLGSPIPTTYDPRDLQSHGIILGRVHGVLQWKFVEFA